MAPKISFAAAVLALPVLLPTQAQTPKLSSENSGASTVPALRFSIYGAVARPGSYQLKPGDRVENALSDAAGPTPRADLGSILVTHAKEPRDPPDMIWINFNDFVLHGKMSGNPLVQAGDDFYILGKGSRYKPLPPEFINL